jgi:hypothetical protein
MTVTLDGTTGVSGVAGQINGSVSSPTLRGVDTNTGVYFPATDQLAIAIDGSIRALFSTTSEFTGSLRNTTSAFLSTDSGALHVGAATAPANSSKAQITNTSGSGDANQSALILSQGGSGENGGQLKLINSYSGVPNPNKSLRVDNSGNLQVINNAYNSAILTLSDAGALTVGSRGFAKSSMPAGSILQVQSVNKTDQFTTTSTSPVDITGLSVSITPSSSSSKILVIGHANISLSGGGGDGFVKLLRDSTAIGNGGGGFFAQVAGQDYFGVHSRTIFYIDSPGTTSAVTYKIQGWCGGNTLWVNGRGLDGGFNVSSQIVVMELAQ